MTRKKSSKMPIWNVIDNRKGFFGKNKLEKKILGGSSKRDVHLTVHSV